MWDWTLLLEDLFYEEWVESLMGFLMVPVMVEGESDSSIYDEERVSNFGEIVKWGVVIGVA